MRRGTREFYADVLSIPEGKSGDFAIEHQRHPAGTEMQTGTLRTSLFGQRSKTVVFDHETLWHSLTEDGGVWMSDLPVEQRQADEMIDGGARLARPPAYGRVLVGGLGLGYVVAALSAKKAVKSITVVEKEADVIKLVEPTLQRNKKPVTVIHADLFDYLRDLPNDDQAWQFEWALYDIWRSDGEHTFHHTVVPLRKLSRGKIDDTNIVCWNEDVMRGQLVQGLQSRIMWDTLPSPDVLPESHQEAAANIKKATIDVRQLAEYNGDIWIDWAVPFWQWYLRAKPAREDAERMAVEYARWYGRVDTSHIEATLLNTTDKTVVEGHHRTAGVARRR